MPTTPSAQPQADNQPDAIADALDAQKQATDDIKGVAEELGVVHAVLDNRIPEDVSHADVGQAIARTDELEKRLNESVKVLEDVTDTLAQEVKSRQATGSETA
ncbi:hypothetical protein [Rhodoferax saidenbachensis]|uniref:Uncharacterized protein n=1 Tax=Rhodoferax saidenbachensis TaxID=1484693 RepID=A0A1P8K7A9_9BURK|nr:hypothetical protein [Rhodoferax saidenbachensis]APW41897.1 hypothetical protein RS694_04640 [Rhodoferax saidenbachensis]